MSNKVKFIQLGTDADPVVQETYNGGVSTERSLAYTKAQYPGAIIFATFLNEDNEVDQEIWANGVKYSVGGGGGGTVYMGTCAIDSNGEFTKDDKGEYTGSVFKGYKSSDNTALDLSSAKFKDGDIYVLCKALGTAWDSLTSTGFVYQNKRWEALAGSVNAENVWFPNGINRTELWGVKAKTNDVQTECAGNNLKTLLEYYLVKPSFPTVTTSYANTSIPTWNISYASAPELKVYTTNAYTTQATNNATVEVGTQYYVPSLSCNFEISATQGTDSLTTGAAKTFAIGPASLTGINYGFWSSDAIKNGTATKDTRILPSNNTLTFNGTTYTTGTNSYISNNTSKTATATYTYTKSVGTIKLTGSGFGLSTLTSSNAATATITAQTLTVQEGDNSLSVSCSNNNYWSVAYTNNTIPASNTVYIASNQYETTADGANKSAQTAAKIVGTDGTKKATYTLGTVFKITGVYPVYVNDVKQTISTVNSSNVKGHEFTKPETAGTAYTIKTNVQGTLQVYAAGTWGNHTNYTRTSETKTFAGKSVTYYIYTPDASDGKGTKYKIV